MSLLFISSHSSILLNKSSKCWFCIISIQCSLRSLNYSGYEPSSDIINWRYRIIRAIIDSFSYEINHKDYFQIIFALFFTQYSFCLTLKYFIIFIWFIWYERIVMFSPIKQSNCRLLNSIFNGIYETIWCYPLIYLYIFLI